MCSEETRHPLPHATTFGGSGDPHMWEVTRAVRTWWENHGQPEALCVALSGGADSLALTAGAIRTGAQVTALIVDHQLQEGSADVAAHAAQQARQLGCVDARVITVTVTDSAKQGMEAAARAVRYQALEQHRAGQPVLLGHTQDDQAETLLLGLVRGSGPRAIAGMREWDAPWGRPLLGVPRAVTRAACAEHGIDYWDDPHNEDPRFARVRIRHELLPLLRDIANADVTAAIARTAELVAQDTDHLDAMAATLLEQLAEKPVTETAAAALAQPAADLPTSLPTQDLSELPLPLLSRVLRSWVHSCGGADMAELNYVQLQELQRLVTDWSGQGPVALPADNRVARRHNKLLFLPKNDEKLGK
ncbi:MAG TPA: tRNA lysidine(34) synthetase TilS [Corynebacteriales bacterium]|nr:tRNA lysidine(34) synthetase TilS [Mycobacteriales bacterium]